MLDDMAIGQYMRIKVKLDICNPLMRGLPSTMAMASRGI